MVESPAGIYAQFMATDLPKLLGQRIRDLRTAAGMTQEEFCEATGISQSYLSELENGKTRGAWRSLDKLATRLERVGVDPMELFRLDQPAVPPQVSEAIDLLRTAPAEVQALVLQMLRISTPAAAPGDTTAARG